MFYLLVLVLSIFLFFKQVIVGLLTVGAGIVLTKKPKAAMTSSNKGAEKTPADSEHPVK